MDFFRRTEISGFADMYYTWNFNTPARPCTTAGGVAVFGVHVELREDAVSKGELTSRRELLEQRDGLLSGPLRLRSSARAPEDL